MKKSPCANCENKGCGSYHDKCEAYQEFAAERRLVSKIKEGQINEEYGFIKQKLKLHHRYKGKR